MNTPFSAQDEARKRLCLHCDWDKEEDYVEGKGHRHGDKFYPCEAESIRTRIVEENP